MKKLLVITFLFISSLTAFAQFEKGDILLGGSLYFSQAGGESKQTNNNYKYPVYRSYAILPEAGLMLTNRFYLGISTGVYEELSKETPEGNTIKERRSSSLIVPISIVGRRFFNLNEKLQLFAGAEMGYGIMKTEYLTDYYTINDIRSKSKGTAIACALNAGMSYFLSPRFVGFCKWSALTANFSKTVLNVGETYETTRNEYFVTFGASSYVTAFNAGVFFVLK